MKKKKLTTTKTIWIAIIIILWWWVKIKIKILFSVHNNKFTYNARWGIKNYAELNKHSWNPLEIVIFTPTLFFVGMWAYNAWALIFYFVNERGSYISSTHNKLHFCYIIIEMKYVFLLFLFVWIIPIQPLCSSDSGDYVLYIYVFDIYLFIYFLYYLLFNCIKSSSRECIASHNIQWHGKLFT